jgi:glutaredoxin-like protein NrdH
MPLAVTLYSKPACVGCTATKRLLKQLDVPYEEEDALEENNMAAIKSLGYMQAPVVVVAKNGPGSEEHWSGFDADRIKSILK